MTKISIIGNGTIQHPVSWSDTLRRTQASLLAKNTEPGFNQGETPENTSKGHSKNNGSTLFKRVKLSSLKNKEQLRDVTDRRLERQDD